VDQLLAAEQQPALPNHPGREAALHRLDERVVLLSHLPAELDHLGAERLRHVGGEELVGEPERPLGAVGNPDVDGEVRATGMWPARLAR
jgi:hypothetical protein